MSTTTERAAAAAQAFDNGTQRGQLLAHIALLGEFGRRGEAPTVADFLLDCGHFFEYRPRPSHVTKEPDKECYRNALMLAREDGLHYCEGWATSIIPVMHAWCIDDNGIVVDPTWEPLDTPDYYGVILDTELSWGRVTRQGYWGILPNWRDGVHELSQLLANPPENEAASEGAER